MPYCDACEKYWTPSSVGLDGTCRSCGRPLDPPETDDDHGVADADEKVPWHFKLMIVALVLYLGWRFVELGIEIFG